jgi:hypothetical protein
MQTRQRRADPGAGAVAMRAATTLEKAEQRGGRPLRVCSTRPSRVSMGCGQVTRAPPSAASGEEIGQIGGIHPLFVKIRI